MNEEEIESKKQRTYEILSAYFVIAGAVKLSEKYLSRLPFDEVLDMAYSNGISIQFGTDERISKY